MLCGDWGITSLRKWTYKIKSNIWRLWYLQQGKIWENPLVRRINKTSGVFQVAQVHTCNGTRTFPAHTPILGPPAKLPGRGDQPSLGLCDNALTQCLSPLLSELYLGTVFPFKGTEKKEGQGYWCIKWLRNVCHLKPFHFLLDTTKKLFNKVSLSFP